MYAAATEGGLARRTSSRDRSKSSASEQRQQMLNERLSLEPDFMTPNWATAVITGLGRLLVPYTSRESKRGHGGGLGRRGNVPANGDGGQVGGEKGGGESGVEEGDPTDGHSDFCGVCKRSGKLLCCDGCDSSFHLKCVGLKSTPRGKWKCMPCRQKEEMAEFIWQPPPVQEIPSSSKKKIGAQVVQQQMAAPSR